MGRRLMRRLPDQLLAAALMLFCAARACAGGIEPARDLRADAKASGRDGMPLIVFFSSYSCPYCEQVATLHLEPLIEHGSTVGAVRVREVEIASGKTLRDFAGARMTHAEFADRENVSVTPVVKFFGPDGAEIASPLVGYSNADFYGDYLDASLRAARSTGWGQRRDSAPIR
jgi:thioredoxin-related protein